jgi:N6-adenosine-specific RNA methylase IME4
MPRDPWVGLTPPYSTIVADPPWRYPNAAATKANANRFYSTMPIEAIKELPVAELAADNAHLYLWALNGLMEEAHQVVRAWGFQPITIITWCKPSPGVGHYFRSNTEHAIFATRGKPMTPTAKPLSTWYQWQRGVHSAKPAAFGDLVERVSPGPYVELFSRQPRFGWASWGHGYEHLRKVAQ